VSLFRVDRHRFSRGGGAEARIIDAGLLPIAPVTVLFWTALLFVGMVDLVAVKSVGLSFTGWTLLDCPFGIAAGLGIYGFARKFEWVRDLGLFLALWTGWTVLIAILSYCLAMARFPLVDAPLTRVDRALGLNWAACDRFIWGHGAMRVAAICAYHSLPLQVFGSVFYLANKHPRRRNEELFASAALAALVTVLVSGVMPAIGLIGTA
jgi:hypothetical protein